MPFGTLADVAVVSCDHIAPDALGPSGGLGRIPTRPPCWADVPAISGKKSLNSPRRSSSFLKSACTWIYTYERVSASFFTEQRWEKSLSVRDVKEYARHASSFVPSADIRSGPSESSVAPFCMSAESLGIVCTYCFDHRDSES